LTCGSYSSLKKKKKTCGSYTPLDSLVKDDCRLENGRHTQLGDEIREK